MVWLPGVCRVMEPVPVPATSPIGSKTAWASELVRVTTAWKEVTTFPDTSRAVTVIWKGTPATAGVGALTEKRATEGARRVLLPDPPHPLRSSETNNIPRIRHGFFIRHLPPVLSVVGEKRSEFVPSRGTRSMACV